MKLKRIFLMDENAGLSMCLWFTLFMIWVHPTQAQQWTSEVDSIEQVLVSAEKNDEKCSICLKLLNYYCNVDLQKSNDILVRAMTYCRMTNNDSLIAESHLARSLVLKDSSVLLNLDTALEIFKSIRDTNAMLKTFRNMANQHLYLKNYHQAIFSYRKSILTAKSSNNFLSASIASNNLGNAYNDIRFYEEALESYKSAAEYAKKASHQYVECICNGAIGDMLLRLGIYDSALFFTEKSIVKCRSLGPSEGLARSYSTMAGILGQTGSLDSALAYGKRSIALADSLNWPFQLAYATFQTANACLLRNDVTEGLKLLDQTVLLSKANENRSLEEDAYRVLEKYYAGLPQIDKAYEYRVLADSVHENGQLLGFQRQLLKEQFVQVQSFEQQELDNLKNEISAEKRLIWTVFLLGLLIIGLLVIYGYSYVHKTKKIRSTNAELQQLNLLFQGQIKKADLLNEELNHRTKNILQTIQRLLQTLIALPVRELRPSKVQNIIERLKIFEKTSERLHLRDDHYLIGVQKNLADNILYFAEQHGVDKLNFSLEKSGKEKFTLPNFSTWVTIVVHELFVNSIKHAGKQPNDLKISIRIETTEREISIAYRDNGKGIGADIEKRLQSNEDQSGGLHLIQSFVKVFDGSINFNAGLSESEVFLKLPFPDINQAP